ncbi:MAG: DNA primase noncatalytic subunit PriX [Candidatus Micrarchaeia archaeon]
MPNIDLDFAYKYPFSDEAKKVVADLLSLGARIDDVHLSQAKEHIEFMLAGKSTYFVDTGSDYVKKDYLVTYLYARMLVSARQDYAFVEKFAEAEAKRSADAAKSDSIQNISRLGIELGINLSKEGQEFTIGFADYLKYKPQANEYSLANQKLYKGFVYLDKNGMVAVLSNAFKSKIKAGLPIPISELPKEVVAFYKFHPFRMREQEVKRTPSSKGIVWVERLLNYPILDGRHRIVNQVLAPYFVNVKGLSVDEAVNVISNYIEKCKQANPDTRINEQYIRYQCIYAKKKGLRVLSAKKARELLGNEIMDRIENKEQAL